MRQGLSQGYGSLLDAQDRELEQQLLRAGKDVELSSAAQARILTGLGVTVAMTASGKAAASTGLVGKLLGGKAGLIGGASLLSVGAVTAGVYLSAAPSVRAPASVVAHQMPLDANQVRAYEQSSKLRDQKAAPVSDGRRAQSASAGSQTADEASSVKRAPHPAAAPRVSPRAASNEGLGEELALVEAASRATRAGNGPLALQRLAEYRRAFPRGKLALEAQVLRIEALALAGRRGEASRLAQAFLKYHPDSPVAARIRRYAD